MNFLRKKSTYILATCIFLYLLSPLLVDVKNQKLESLPVFHQGRIKPLESVAKQTVLTLNGKQTLRNESAMEWTVKTLINPREADKDPVFLIHNPQLVSSLGVVTENITRFSFHQIQPGLETLFSLANAAERIEEKERTQFDKDVILLRNKIITYMQLKASWGGSQFDNPQELYHHFKSLVPIGIKAIHHPQEEYGQSLLQLKEILDYYVFLEKNALFYSLYDKKLQHFKPFASGPLGVWQDNTEHPLIIPILSLITALKSNQKNEAALNAIHQFYKKELPSDYRKVQLEYWFDQVNPLYKCILLYGIIFVGMLLIWLGIFTRFKPLFYKLCILTFIIHTVSIILRIMIQGRPPVTNLYSSAIFVGWASIFIALVLEKFNRRGIGTLVSGLIGFLTLIIAHHLSLQGDSFHMLQAVLDSNFWLTTHVLTICLGYSAMFVAGFLGFLFIIKGVFTKKLMIEEQESLQKMVLSTLGFAMLFSTIGTILGGIWADQSWGRFWGWDPKENGAILIVLWIAIIFHARILGILKQRGLMIAVVFGNIITSFSWFGVNMLGVGLHSYGFMESALVGLMAFMVAHMYIMAIGFIPKKYWKSSLK